MYHIVMQFMMCHQLRHESAFRITGPLCGEYTGDTGPGSIIQSFDNVFVVSLTKPLTKQSRGRWNKTTWHMTLRLRQPKVRRIAL